MKYCTKNCAYCAILLQCLGNLCASFLAHEVAHKGKEKRCKIVFQTICSVSLAEREGFEPPDPRRSTVFKTAAFDRSAIFPVETYVVVRVTLFALKVQR